MALCFENQPRMTLRVLSEDAFGVALSFLDAGTLCSIRRTCWAFNHVITSDGFWSIMCTAYGIGGRMIGEEEDPRNPEPHFLRFGAAPTTSMTLFAPWKMLLALWSSIGCCEHMQRPVVIEALKNCAAQFQLVRHNLPALCSSLACQARGYKGTYMCMQCGGIFCARDGNGCMASHQCIAPRVGVRRDYDSVRCYDCFPEKEMNWKYTPMPKELTDMCAPRDLRVAYTHSGLFQRNQCPHVDPLISRVANFFPRQRAQVVNASCSWVVSNPPTPPKWSKAPAPLACRKMTTHFCLTCFSVLCGAEEGGHMHTHCLKYNHFVVVCVRSLDIWCYSCCRFVGFGGSQHDFEAAAQLRRIMRSTSLLYQHRALEEMDNANATEFFFSSA